MPRELEALNPDPSEHRLEHVLQRKLCDTRASPVLTRDGSEGCAGGQGARSAWVVEDGVVQDVEIFDTEVQLGFAVNREAASQRGIPDSKARAAQRVLDDIAIAGSGPSVSGD